MFCPEYRPQSFIVLLYISLINRCHTGINKPYIWLDMQFELTVVCNTHNRHIMVSHIYIFFGFWLYMTFSHILKAKHMQVYKKYIIHYSTILSYYVKVGHNLTFVTSMKLPKHVASQRRTENKGISILLLVEPFKIMMQTSLVLRNKDRKLAHTCNSSFRYKVDVLSLSNSRIGDQLHRIYPH